MDREILQILEKTKFPSKQRKNLSDSNFKSLTLGLIHRQFSRYKGYSIDTTNNEDLYFLLLKWAKTFTDLTFTTISINKNVMCKPHKDAKNDGMTMIVGLGDYTGGELWIDNQTIDIHNRPYFFNGYAHLHYNLPHLGTRYSIMFYCYRVKIDIIHRPEDVPIVNEVLYGNAYQNRDFVIEKGELWIDIGAHIGCFAKKVLTNGANVICYEPSQSNYDILVQNISPSMCKKIAVGSHNGLVSVKEGSRHYFDRIVDGGDVQCLSFDQVVSKDVCVKMDIEGSELEILDQCNFSGLKKMVIAYHTNRDPLVENLGRRVDRLKTFFKQVYHAPVKEEIKMNRFPNELFIFCWN